MSELNIERLESLEKNVTSIRRELGLWRALALVLVLVICLIFYTRSGSDQREIAANRFVLRGDKASINASLEINEHAMPSLKFYNPKGEGLEERLVAELDEDGDPSICIFDKKKMGYVSIMIKNGVGMVSLQAPDRVNAVRLISMFDELAGPSSAVSFWGEGRDKQSYEVLGIVVDSDTTARIDYKNRDQTNKISIETKEKSGFVTKINEEEK